jgi:flagellar hook-length control protein FliK
MSLIPSPTVASSQAGTPPSHAAARNEAQDPNNPGSFGEVLSRSLEPAATAIEKTTGKASALARRQADNQKTDPATPTDPVNALALPFIPLESRTAKMPSGGTPSLNGTVVQEAAGAALTTTPPESAALATAGSAAMADLPTDTGTQPAQAAALASTALAAPESMAMATADTAKGTLPPALAAAALQNAAQAGPPNAAPAAPQTQRPAANDSPAVALDPREIAGQPQPTAPDTGSADASPKHGHKAANKSDDMRDVSSASGATGDTSNAATPGTADLAFSGNQTPAPDASSTSLAASLNPVNAAAQGPLNISSSTSAQPVATRSLTPEVGSSEWGKALGQQVIQMGHAGHQVAELQLNPPGLGPLKVTLSMNDHQIQAMFVSAHSSVRAAVEAALPQLRATLADSGISLGNTSVNSGSQQQAAFAQSQNGNTDQRGYRGDSWVESAALTPQPVIEAPRRSNGIGVDTYA